MGAKRIVTLPPCAALVALAAPSVRHLLLLPRSAPGTRPCPSPVPRGQAFPSWAAACHGGGARSWQEMEEPPLRFFRDIFPENHADLSWVPDRMDPNSSYRLAIRVSAYVKLTDDDGRQYCKCYTNKNYHFCFYTKPYDKKYVKKVVAANSIYTN
ncbi:uncharacterized protein LOC112876174 isoform X1 [Panicum hallii]|uniref:uncharacterized protein LOC112876174 isoform X1 n=1 Tax=Panicum hallii TaxID=206008 RepID=UPI000DF4D26A|nr:uncharacterized protein LOC112876174 isoform X1 [Panicum hallii]